MIRIEVCECGPNDHIQRRTVARQEERTHGHACAKFYTDPDQWRLADSEMSTISTQPRSSPCLESF